MSKTYLKMNKVLSVFLALMLCLSFSMTAFASVDSIAVSPIKNYSGLLPAVSSITSENVWDNWMIVRQTTSSFHSDTDGSPSNYDENRYPIFNETTEWKYLLVFFSDDFQPRLISASNGIAKDKETGEYVSIYYPRVDVSASSMHVYVLTSPDCGSSYGDYFTDGALEECRDKKWTYEGASDYENLFWYAYNQEVAYNSSALNSYLNNVFVASNFSALIPSADNWGHKYTDEEGNSTFDRYTSSSISWSVSLYDDTDESEEPEESTKGILAWLKKIYNSMCDGFSAILQKITGSSEAEKEKQEKVESEMESNQGQIDESLGTITGSQEDANEYQNSDEWHGVNDFFAFMRNLWDCIPGSITGFISMSVILFMVIAVIKIFF